MKNQILKKAAPAFVFALLSTVAHAAGDLTARQIMEKNFYSSKVSSFTAVSEMTLINAQGEKRERKLNNIQKIQPNGIDSKIVAKFLEPADVRGTGFLQVEHSDADDDQWIYLPALQKSRRLVANNKKDSFFGSDISYGDISLPKVDAYKHTLLKSEMLGKFDCYVIESVPATAAFKDDTGYSKKVSWIRKDSFLEAKVDYYDLNGELLKTQLVTGHHQVEKNPDHWLAETREVTNVQTGHKTIFTFSKIQAGIPIDDSVFTTRQLEHP